MNGNGKTLSSVDSLEAQLLLGYGEEEEDEEELILPN